MKEKIGEAFGEFWEKVVNLTPNFLLAIAIVVVFFAIAKTYRSLYKNKLQQEWKNTIIARFLSQVIYWVLIIIGLLVALNILGFDKIASSLLAGAGISAIIVGFAFKDIAENFLAGILLTINRPFSIGDVIEIGNFKGPVRSVDLRSTHIRLSDGRDIWIPNSMLIKGVLTNYTRDGLLRQEFIVGIDPTDNVVKAKDLIIKMLHEQPDVLDIPQPDVWVDELATSTVNIKVLFWIDVLKKLRPEGPIALGAILRSEMMWRVKDLLLENGFSMPSIVLEHKMHKEKEPLKMSLENREGIKTTSGQSKE